MASISTVNNGDVGLDVRTILNEIIAAVNSETVSSISESGGVITITHKDASTTTLDLSGSFQETLISGTNIKSINGTTLLGSGDIEIEGTTVLDEDDYASNSAVLAPSQQSVKYNDDILKGASGLTGATLTFTKKEQVYNAATPSSAATVTIDSTGAIAPSMAIFYSNGTSVTLQAAGAEVIKDAQGQQPSGVGLLMVFYDGTSFWPSWRSTIDVKDEDDFASNSATSVPTQQSTGEYIKLKQKAVNLGAVNNITFGQQTAYSGTDSEPRTGNITVEYTAASDYTGATVIIAHKDTAAPTISFTNGGSLMIPSIGEYLVTEPSTLNVMVLTHVAGGKYILTYVQNISAIGSLAEDTTPQLGGDLDGQNYDITGVTDIQIKGQAYSDGEVDDGNADTTETIDWTTANFHKSTLTANCTYTFTAPSGATTLIMKLVNGGAFTPTWPATVKWAGGTEPSWTASGTDVLSFYYDGTNYYGAAILDLQ